MSYESVQRRWPVRHFGWFVASNLLQMRDLPNHYLHWTWWPLDDHKQNPCPAIAVRRKQLRKDEAILEAKNRKEAVKKEKASLRTRVRDEKASIKFINSVAKPCRCGQFIQKSDGCDHMTRKLLLIRCEDALCILGQLVLCFRKDITIPLATTLC